MPHQRRADFVRQQSQRHGPRSRRRSLDALRKLNESELKDFGDPETLTRINQYELAFRMQMAVPEVMDIGT